jgi:hypothetical protein
MSDFLLADNTAVGTAINEATLKEQVQDLLINLFPLDTPLQQVCERMNMNSTFMYQPIDTYNDITRVSSLFDASANFVTTNAKPEGFTYVSGTPQYPAKLKSVAEIQGRAFGVSGTDRAVAMWGITDRYVLEALKKTQAVVNGFEMSFHWSPGSSEFGVDLNTGGGLQSARQTQGLVFWIAKSGLQRSKLGLGVATANDGHGNNFGTGGGALNAGASSWMYDAAGLPLDQAMFKDNLMAQWYNITGRQANKIGLCGAKIKNLFSQFALTANGAINERTLSAASKEVIDTVDYYTTDFGRVGLNLDRYLNISGQSVSIAQTTGSTTVPYDEVLIFMDPAYFKIGVLRPVTLESIGKTRDAEDGQVTGEQAFVCLNPQGGAGIVNCLP